MGRIVVSELTTLDGVIEDPVGVEGFEHGGWALGIDQGEEGRQIKLEEIFMAEALLLGRVTHECLAGIWPEGRDGLGVAEKIDAMPKYVVSSLLDEPARENTTVMRGDVVWQVMMLKDQLDGEILVRGSAQLVRTLFEEGLIDELRMMVYPVMLGAGKPLFALGTERRPMRLAGGDVVGEGISYLVFEPRWGDSGECEDSWCRGAPRSLRRGRRCPGRAPRDGGGGGPG